MARIALDRLEAMDGVELKRLAEQFARLGEFCSAAAQAVDAEDRGTERQAREFARRRDDARTRLFADAESVEI